MAGGNRGVGLSPGHGFAGVVVGTNADGTSGGVMIGGGAADGAPNAAGSCGGTAASAGTGGAMAATGGGAPAAG